MSKMIQDGIRADEKIFKLAKEIANNENRSKNSILLRWLINGMNLEIKSGDYDGKKENT